MATDSRSSAVMLAHLVNGTSALDRVRGLTEAVAVFERAIVELVGADDVTTFVRDESLDHQLVQMGDGDDESGPMPLTMIDESVLRIDGLLTDHRRHHFVPELRSWPVLEGGPTLLPEVRSALFIPLDGLCEKVGFALVGWRGNVAGLSEVAEQAVDVLIGDAAETIDRFHRERALANSPLTDPLTGLLSRRSVDLRLVELVPGDVLMVIDLDGFRAYVDHHGTGAGDRTMRTLAACLVDSCRREDWCGRLSTEELIVGFRGAAESVTIAISRLKERWAELHPEITFSAGVAVHHGRSVPRDTLAHATGALDLAKDRGRDRVEVFPGRLFPDLSDAG